MEEVQAEWKAGRRTLPGRANPRRSMISNRQAAEIIGISPSLVAEIVSGATKRVSYTTCSLLTRAWYPRYSMGEVCRMAGQPVLGTGPEDADWTARIQQLGEPAGWPPHMQRIMARLASPDLAGLTKAAYLTRLEQLVQEERDRNG